MTFTPEASINAEHVCSLCGYRRPTVASVDEQGTIAVRWELCPHCDDPAPMGVELHRTPELPAESYIETLISVSQSTPTLPSGSPA